MGQLEDILFFEVLARITQQDLVLSGTNELVFAVGQPLDRVYVFYNIWKRKKTLSDDFGAQIGLDLAQVEVVLGHVLVQGVEVGELRVGVLILVSRRLEVVELLLLIPDILQVPVHVALDVPNQQTRLARSGVVVARRKYARVHSVPGQRVAVPRVLNHPSRHEHLLSFGWQRHPALPVIGTAFRRAHGALSLLGGEIRVDERYLAVGVRCKDELCSLEIGGRVFRLIEINQTIFALPLKGVHLSHFNILN